MREVNNEPQALNSHPINPYKHRPEQLLESAKIKG